MSKPVGAISSLVEIIKAIPTDAEAWCELADLYMSQGMTHQATFCLEESLLIAANAWNVSMDCQSISTFHSHVTFPQTFVIMLLQPKMLTH